MWQLSFATTIARSLRSAKRQRQPQSECNKKTTHEQPVDGKASSALFPPLQIVPHDYALTRASAVIYLEWQLLWVGLPSFSNGTVLVLGAGPPFGFSTSNMDRKRILLYALAFVVFLMLVYMQFRTWRNFDWATFWRESRNLGKPPHIFHLFHAVALIYVAYIMRALRWKIFLRPVRPQASTWNLLSPDADRFHRIGAAGTPGGTHPPLSDCAAGETDVLFAVGGLGR